MGTRRRGEAHGRPHPGRARPAGRTPRNRLEKIPIPPVPAFLRSTARAPEKKREPDHDRLAEIISGNAISDEEADLLLGVTSPPEPDGTQSAPGRLVGPEIEASPAAGSAEGALSADETDDLAGFAPGPVLPAPEAPAARREPSDETARSGASGAAVINELVDEIEKDLERVLDRQAPAVQARRYGRIIGCWVSPIADASPAHGAPAARHRNEEEGTS